MNAGRIVPLRSQHDRYQAALDGANTEPGVRIAHPKLCHPACAPGCNECVRTRSEAVGAEFEPPSRYDATGSAALRDFAIAVIRCVAAGASVLLLVHFLARFA